MCVIFLAIADTELILGKYKLVLLNNRDENFARETSELAWRNGILAGRDEKANEHGTWLGVDAKGRIASMLSITQPYHLVKNDAPSRGRIVNDFLCSNLPAADFLSELFPKAHNFNGFQFLILDRIDGKYELYSLTNMLCTTGPIRWPKGIYGFGNSPRAIPFKKVVYGESKFNELLEHFKLNGENDEDQLVNALFQMASDRTAHFPDEQIRVQTGAPEGDQYKRLCSLFVDGLYPYNRHYGTRSTSVILVDSNDNVSFHERRVLDQAKPMNDPTKWQFTVQRFTINS